MLTRIDNFILDRFQRHIADPLQERGVGLLTQFRAVTAVAFVCVFFVVKEYLLKRSFWSAAFWGIGLVIRLSDVFFVNLDSNREARLSPGDTESVNANPYRFMHAGRRLSDLVLGVLFLSIVMSGGSEMLSWFGMCLSDAVRQYVDACDPKPPRPKRIKVLVESFDA